jgi:16S rRNA (uracil1498-N3)-methyltransferase
MKLPYFFVENISSKEITLDEDASKHIISVLRMTKGEKLLLTDGKGKIAEASIVDDNRKRCAVILEKETTQQPLQPNITIAISLIKNSSRFEWFLEKATEIGINEIIPLICERTEKEKFRFERMQGLLVSAMLQSQQAWLPKLHPPTDYNEVLNSFSDQKFIAHCIDSEKQSLAQYKNVGNKIILIGPEGDFTPGEISAALKKDFTPVSLGSTRLRTETAGMVAATLLRNL